MGMTYDTGNEGGNGNALYSGYNGCVDVSDFVTMYPQIDAFYYIYQTSINLI